MNPFSTPIARRSLIGLAALSLLPTLHAQEAWPTRPITLIHPYAAGGPADNLARALGRQLEARLKQPIVVDGRGGGGATIGTAAVARAKPDGYTLLLGTSAGHVVTPLMQRIAYDGIGDFRFIAAVASQPNVLVANLSAGVNNVPELIAMARKEPGRLNYASAGMGGATHLGAEAFAQAAKIKLTHVPYSGAAPALKDVIGGQVQLAMLNLSATRPFIADGKLKPLAYGGSQRTPLLPGVPTLAELGYGNTATATWYTLAAPKGTPDNVVEAVRAAVAQAGADPEYIQALATLGAERMDLSPQETTALVQRDKTAMTQLLGSLGMLEK
jgi:tripartite-type tricarboxylate transporter receptor subunit TctC